MKRLGVGLALATLLATAANAGLTEYVWQQNYTASGGGLGSGQLYYNGSYVSSFSFTYPSSANPDTAFDGNAAVLGDGDLQLSGNSYSGPDMTWGANAPGGLYENGAFSALTPGYYILGAWVAVPEPTTVISAILLLLLPVGASARRMLRKTQGA